MKVRWPAPRRIFKWLLIAILLFMLVDYVAIPAMLGYVATRSHHEDVGAPPEGFHAVVLRTADDLKLGAWYAMPQNGAVIVLVPGAGGSREDVRSYADFLVKHGFGVLALEQRGCGESEGDANLFGWHGTTDVAAALGYLGQQPNIRAVGGLGLSLGGEVLLGASGELPALQAVVSDGASYRSYDDYYDLPAHQFFLNAFTARVTFFSAELFSGDHPPTQTLHDAISRSGSTRYLFIAGGKNSQEVDYNERYAHAVGERGTLWVVADVGHVGAFHRHTEEYEQRVIEFFEQALLAENTPS